MNCLIFKYTYMHSKNENLALLNSKTQSKVDVSSKLHDLCIDMLLIFLTESVIFFCTFVYYWDLKIKITL